MNDRQAFIATIADSLLKADEFEQEYHVLTSIGDGGMADRKGATQAVEIATQLRSNQTTHLVFADWLLEQNDPWHELIRVSCERLQMRDKVIGRLFEHGPIHDPMIVHYAELGKREQELQRELNPFSNSVKVTWDHRGLIVGVEGDSISTLCGWANYIGQTQPICTLRLTNWFGIERSLPRNPAEALPWLFKLELPNMTRFESEWEGTQWVVNKFGLRNGKPRVRVEFYDTEQLVVDYREQPFALPEYMATAARLGLNVPISQRRIREEFGLEEPHEPI